jgi:hypothetical protein
MGLNRNGFVAAALMIAFGTSSAQAAQQPMLSKIECTGKTSDDRAVQIVIVVDFGTTSYPAPITARLRLGADSPEALSATLTSASEPDDSGREFQVFHSALDLHRGFTARTTDMKSGTAVLKLENAVQASQLDCAFTLSGNQAARPASRR